MESKSVLSELMVYNLKKGIYIHHGSEWGNKASPKVRATAISTLTLHVASAEEVSINSNSFCTSSEGHNSCLLLLLEPMKLKRNKI